MRTLILAVLCALSLSACPTDEGDDTATTSTTTTGPDSSGGSSGATTTTTGEATTGGASTSTTTGVVTTSTTGTTDDATTVAATSTTTGPGTTTDVSGSSTGSTTGPPADLFLCDECFCDANISYCRRVLAGVKLPIPPEPVLCEIVHPDEFTSGCVLYPDACGDTPTCDCIPTQNNACFCDEQMGYFTATCPLP